MEQRNEQDPKQRGDFDEAFNDGYTLAKNNPKHLENLMFESESTNPERHRGYAWGQWLYEQERDKDPLENKAIGELRSIRQRSRTLTKSKTIEKDPSGGQEAEREYE